MGISVLCLRSFDHLCSPPSIQLLPRLNSSSRVQPAVAVCHRNTADSQPNGVLALPFDAPIVPSELPKPLKVQIATRALHAHPAVFVGRLAVQIGPVAHRAANAVGAPCSHHHQRVLQHEHQLFLIEIARAYHFSPKATKFPEIRKYSTLSSACPSTCA